MKVRKRHEMHWRNCMLEIRHCKTDEQIADLLTKPLKSSSFDYLKMKLGMAEASN